jgi:RNA polymerase sigma-70 factor (ECF subfamily)
MSTRQLLLRSLANGDAGAGALEAAYDAFAPRLYAVARRLLPVPADAEECVQEVFVGLVERRDQLGRIDDLGAYLFASLRHAAQARGRRGARLRVVESHAAPSEEAAPGQDVLAARVLGRALAALPVEQREVVALKVDGELTFAEIGALLGTSLNTCASRYRYGLARLREALGELP